MSTQADNMHVQAQLTKTNDSGKTQKVKATGRYGEQFGGNSDEHGIDVIQDYGRTAHRPVGSKMHAVIPDGNPDKTLMVGGEHEDHRQKDCAEGEIKDYDMWGHTMHMKEDGWHWKIGGSEVIFGNDGVVTITATTINIIGDVHLGSTGGILAAKLGSIDNDTELNGQDAIVGNVATKVWVT